MFPIDAERLEKNVREATTPDLVDRVTAYRAGMEPDAVDIIEAELRRRGVDWQQLRDQKPGEAPLLDANGIALKCSFCRAPAVEQRLGWHRLWGKIPLFPRLLRYCQEHR